MMKILLSLLCLCLISGCSIYKIKTKRDETGVVTTNVSVYSSREIQEINGAYGRDGPDAYFDFGAKGVTQPGPEDYLRAIGIGAALARGQVPVVEEKED